MDKSVVIFGLSFVNSNMETLVPYWKTWHKFEKDEINLFLARTSVVLFLYVIGESGLNKQLVFFC